MNPRALSSALSSLGTLQPKALRFINTVDLSVSDLTYMYTGDPKRFPFLRYATAVHASCCGGVVPTMLSVQQCNYCSNMRLYAPHLWSKWQRSELQRLAFDNDDAYIHSL